MNTNLLIPLVLVALISMPAHALDCSGGANGGMDATGNECNDATTVGTVVASDGAKFPSARMPKVDTSITASYGESAVKRTSATRHSSARHAHERRSWHSALSKRSY